MKKNFNLKAWAYSLQDRIAKRSLKSLAIHLVTLAALVIIPTVLRSQEILSGSNMTVLNFVGIFGIAAIGFNILLGISGQASLGHAALIGVGSYVSANLTMLDLPIPFPLVLLISGLAAVIVGLALGFPAIRLGGYYLAIATLGFGVVVQQIFSEWTAFTNGYNGMRVASPEILGFVFRDRVHYYYLVLAVLVLMYILGHNLLNGKFGRALKAMRDSSHAAQAMGVNLAYNKLIAFGISAFYAGIAGSLYAHLMRFITPDAFNILMSLNLMAMSVIGGLGSLVGAVLGSGFYQVMPVLVRRVPIQNFSFILTGICLVLIVMLLPYGLVSIPHKIKGLWVKWSARSDKPAPGKEM